VKRAALILSLSFGLAASAAGAEAPKPVQLKPEAVRKLGIATAPAHYAMQRSTAGAFAKVLDPIPLAQLDSDILAAEAALTASSAEAGRVQALYANDATMSRKAAESASMQARSDRARLSLLRRRISLEWGPAIGRLSDAQRAALVAGLASGRTALVRIDATGGAGLEGLRSAELDLGPLGGATAVVMGPARIADGGLQSPGLIARVSGPRAPYLSSGLTMPARIQAGAQQGGIAVPASAVLRVEGGSWVYVQGASGFLRRRLGGVAASPSGLTAASGLREGERVVVRGAAALYAAEQGGGPVED
jgi:hypothetical protein